MSEIQEPYPPQPNSLWGYQSEAWYARFDYINSRVEGYLNNFRESVDYDFTKIHKRVEDAQKDLTLAMEEFAVGSITVEKVKAYAVILRDAFKRPEQKRSELDQAREHFKGKKVNQDTYIPGSIQMERLRQVKGLERVSVFVAEHNKRLFFAGENPPPNVTSCMVEGGGGFDKDGMPLAQYEAELLIDIEVWAIMVKTFGEKAISQEIPAKPETAVKEPEIETTGKTLDEVKAEALKVENEKEKNKRLEKLDRVGKRGKI